MTPAEPRPPSHPTEIEWGPSLLPDQLTRELEAQCKRMFGGVVPNVFKKIAPAPWLVEIWMALMRRRHSVAPPELIDIACFVAAQENACRYCYGGQRAAIRLMGFSEQRVKEIENRVELGRITPRERAVIDYASSVVRMLRRPSDERLLAQGLDRLQVAELTYLISLVTASTRLSTLSAVPPDADFEALPDKLLVRLLRPVIARQMRPEKLPPSTVPAGPFAAVIAPLGETFGARLIRQSLDAMLADGPLPARAKLLIVLAIAHALECRSVGDEAVRLLAAHGLSQAQCAEITTHLGSGALDSLEARLVPLARDSIRYQPLVIQARVREAVAGMDPRTILDVLGAIALGNMLGRLGSLS